VRGIGYPIKPPETVCEDPKCPFHGRLPIRGRVLEGKVKSTRMKSTIMVERSYYHYVSKYKRYERRRRSIAAHLPPCIEVREGDRVKIAECRPISKTVHFIVIGTSNATRGGGE
jgi:small subunit ribosomal protein S17